MPPTLRTHGRRLSQPLRRRAEVLHAIETYFRRYDCAPTVREICQMTRIPSTSYVYYLLAELEQEGYITRESGKSRSIRLTRPRGVPIKGTIAAGEPLDLFETADDEILELALHTRHADGAADEYAFLVHGDSMIEDGIFDGDYVFVRPGHGALPGATVVAVHMVHEASERGAATVKRYEVDRKRKCVRLCPANSALRPKEIPMKVWTSQWAIHGTVTAIYRPCGQYGQPRPRPHGTPLAG